jgi:nucleoside diphosphate kinase
MQAMREKYTKESSSIHYFCIEWDTSKSSWADFRGKVLGATDPTTADEGSLRRTILDKYSDLGLAEVPNVGDNGVHASASPFEALAERYGPPVGPC